MIKIGLMGCGTVAGYGHLPAIASTADLKLEALFEPDANRLNATGQKYAVPHHFDRDMDGFMDAVDVVTITSPAPCHHENVLCAARHKKPVLCEKPLAMTDAQGEEMVAAMEKAGVPLWVGFTYRFSPVAQQIKHMVEQGEIGDVKSARLVYIWDCHGKFERKGPCAGQINQRRHGRMIEGGPMVDCGVHQIDLARWWLNSEVASFVGHGAWVDEYEAPDHVWVHMDMTSGAHVMIESSFSYSHTAKEQRWHYVFELIGTKGVIRYLRDNETFEIWTPDGMRKMDWHGEKNFEGMYEQLVKAIQTGDSGTLATGRDGIEATRIARQATEMAIRARNKLQVEKRGG
jgi:predicted dehydrogenase